MLFGSALFVIPGIDSLVVFGPLVGWNENGELTFAGVRPCQFCAIQEAKWRVGQKCWEAIEKMEREAEQKNSLS